MRKKWIRTVMAALMSVAVLMSSACAADMSEQSEDIAAQAEIVREGGMAFIPERSVYFADVDTNYSWGFHAIDYLANTGVVSGTGNLIYSPGKSLSRADFVLMLYRAYDMEKYAQGENFADVLADAYYADAVLAARAIGIAAGDENNNFNPSRTLTRQDAMVLLKRTLDRTGLQFAEGDLSGCTDADQVADYAVDSVGALVKAGIIGGSDGKLNPTAPVTRAEMAVMLYRALHLQTVDGVAYYETRPAVRLVCVGSTIYPDVEIENTRAEMAVMLYRALHLQTVDGVAYYETRPAVRLVCVGSTIYPDVEIENYQSGTFYAGLYELTQMTKDEDGYSITLGQSQSIDDQIVWDGTNLSVNGEVMQVAADCEAIAVDMYSKRTAGLCSTGDEYKAGAVSVVDGLVQTVYYKK